MVLFNLKKDAGQVRQLMANSLVDICRGSFKYEQELNIEGMLCITLDKQDVLPIPVNIQLQKRAKAASTPTAPERNVVNSSSDISLSNVSVSGADLQSAVLQSLLSKTSNAQPEFIPLSEMPSIGDLTKDQPNSGLKLEKNDGLEMDSPDDVDEGIQISQGSSQNTPTLQDAVGNVIKSYYHDSKVNSSSPVNTSTVHTLSPSTARTLPSSLQVIKVVSSQSNEKSAEEKLNNALPWKKELPKKFQCPMCTYTSDRRFCINRHMKLHVGRAGVQCQICRNIFADHWYLTKVHMPKHHPEAIEGTTSKTNDNNKNTVLTAKECSIKCPVCPFAASSAISFRNHLNTHTRDCLKCGLRFLTPADVQQHVHQQHGSDVDYSEYIYDPDMAEHLEESALRNAVHLTPSSSTTSTTTPTSESTGNMLDAQQTQVTTCSAEENSVDSATGQLLDHSQDDDNLTAENDQGLYNPPTDHTEQLLLNHNYMMVVNNTNQVQIHSADGTVMEGILSEDGQVYTTQEVPVQQLIKKEDAMEEDPT